MIDIVSWEGEPGKSGVKAVSDGIHTYERRPFSFVFRYGQDGRTEMNSWDIRIPSDVRTCLYGLLREIPESQAYVTCLGVKHDKDNSTHARFVP